MDDKEYLKLALEQAKLSIEKGGFPAGAVVVKNGEIITKDISIDFILQDPTSHAETAAIRKACRRLKTSNLDGATLYESLACCVMCFSVANWAGISRIVSGAQKTPEMVAKRYYEGTTDIYELNNQNTRKIELVYLPDFEQKSLELIKKWEQQNP